MPLRSAPQSLPKPELASVGFNLGFIAIGVALAGLLLAYAINGATHQVRDFAHLDSTEQRLSRSLVGKDFSIPQSWFRGAQQAEQGFAAEIDLQLPLALGKDGAPALVDVTLVPRSQARPSASLLDGVYLHQFQQTELAGPRGLVGKPLLGTDGYEDETVWYDALSANPFVAKCMLPADGRGPSRCLRTVVLSSAIAAVYQFDADVLPAWKQFDPEMKKWLDQIGAL